jgi:hypothetical protein
VFWRLCVRHLAHAARGPAQRHAGLQVVYYVADECDEDEEDEDDDEDDDVAFHGLWWVGGGWEV